MPLTKEQLIEELKKIEGVDCNERFAVIADGKNMITYSTIANQVQITTDVEHEEGDENTIYYNDLSPDCILELFKKWK